MDLPDRVTECALDSGGSVCSSKGLVVDIDKALKINIVSNVPISEISDDTMAQVIETAKKVTKCPNEKCVLNNVDGMVNAAELARIKKFGFKLKGPAMSTKLLNNFNIDHVLDSLAQVPKHKGFYHMLFQMIDFYGTRSLPPTELATVDICKDVIDAGYNCLGVVLNTDTRSGRGKHWFCIFCDFRSSGSAQDPYTVEYFNSSGNPPLDPVLNWLNETAKKICHYPFGQSKRHGAKVIASKIRHQKSETECGPYSLYYIWSRLNKVPIQEFRNKPVPDARMIEFRKHLFA